MSDSEVRPEVVDAVYGALLKMDPASLRELEASGTGITAAERAAGEQLYAASLLASQDHRSRRLRAMQVLFGGRQNAAGASWAELFGDLSPAGAAELRDLHDALPDGARAEFDRRYGPPREDG